VVHVPTGVIGTYIPELYSERLKATVSRIQSSRAAKSAGLYAVVVPSAEYIYSNITFDDQYALDPAEFSHNWNQEDLSRISDGKGNWYLRIAEDTEYGMALERYYPHPHPRKVTTSG
jgi:hypothetical protein